MIEVKLVNYTKNPEITVASAARTCFRDKTYESICEELKEEDIERIIKTVIIKNHMSVLEHINFTFSIVVEEPDFPKSSFCRIRNLYLFR